MPDSERPFLPDALRDKHVYIAGKSGHGKSTLLHAQAYQDIRNGKGVCVIDPSGDLVNKLIHWIPRERVDDCIYLDTRNPVPIDFFSYRDAREKEILTDDIILLFDAPNAPRMRGILRKLIPTLFEVNENPRTPPDLRTSFLDIYNFFVVKRRKDEILKYVSKERYDYWQENFPRPDAIEPITYRMAPFTESPTLRTIFGTPDAKLNIWDAMQSGKVLLVNIDINETDKIFGTMLVSKIQQAAFRRRDLPEAERKPFCLYVDEFENYQTSAFDVILSQGRKFQLWLTLSHQWVSQLNEKIRDAVFGTVSTFILFRLSSQDALRFRDELGDDAGREPYSKMLTRLPEYEALYRIGKEPIRICSIPSPPPYKTDSYANEIRQNTLARYAPSARIAQIAAAEISDCKIAPVLHHGADDDDIKPTASPMLQVDKNKKKHP
jgi:hypothetical protein